MKIDKVIMDRDGRVAGFIMSNGEFWSEARYNSSKSTENSNKEVGYAMAEFLTLEGMCIKNSLDVNKVVDWLFDMEWVDEQLQVTEVAVRAWNVLQLPGTSKPGNKLLAVYDGALEVNTYAPMYEEFVEALQGVAAVSTGSRMREL